MPNTGINADYYDELVHIPMVYVLGVLDIEDSPVEASPSWYMPAGDELPRTWAINASGPQNGGTPMTIPIKAVAVDSVRWGKVGSAWSACPINGEGCYCGLTRVSWSHNITTIIKLSYTPGNMTVGYLPGTVENRVPESVIQERYPPTLWLESKL
jgi:hypothetical protein